jgi:hypothetical protein
VPKPCCCCPNPAGDLDPSSSTHHLVPLKTAYLKLHYLLDAGCVFVGHGLKQDFRIINLTVPPEQVCVCVGGGCGVDGDGRGRGLSFCHISLTVLHDERYGLWVIRQQGWVDEPGKQGVCLWGMG